MSWLDSARLTTMRQSPRYGPILDPSLKLWFPPTARPGSDNPRYPGSNLGSDPSNAMTRAGLPALFYLVLYANAANVEPRELSALIAGFDAEDDSELADAIGAHPNHIDAVRFGHDLAVSLGLLSDHSYSQNSAGSARSL